MDKITVALLQTAFDPAPEAMTAKFTRLTQAAVKQGATLICLPEFSLSPYFAAYPAASVKPEILSSEGGAGGASCGFFARLAAECGVTIVGSLYELDNDDQNVAAYDTAVVYAPEGKRIGACRKQHIPDDIGYYERNYFGPGNSDYPVFALPKIKIAAPTCYDQWFPELARIFALNGAELIVYPTAIGSEPSAPDCDSQPAWTIMLRSHAIANGVFVAATNRIGEESGIAFYGSSVLIAPDGEILAQASRDREEIVLATLEPERLTEWRRLFPLLERREPQTYKRICDE